MVHKSALANCDGAKVVETWAMQDRLGLLQQLGAISELQPVNWAGGNQPSSPGDPAAVTGSPRWGLVPVLVIPCRLGVPVWRWS